MGGVDGPATSDWSTGKHRKRPPGTPAPPPLGERLRLLSHHTAHVLSAFPLAEVDRAAGLVVDAGGSALGADLAGRERISGYHLTWSAWERVYHALPSYAPATAGRLVRRAHSLGHFYRNLAVRCIPPGDEPEGSMMALAALGARAATAITSALWSTSATRARYVSIRPWAPTIWTPPICLGGQVWSRDTAARAVQDRADLAAAAQELFEDADRVHNLRDLPASTNPDRSHRFRTQLVDFYLPLARSRAATNPAIASLAAILAGETASAGPMS